MKRTSQNSSFDDSNSRKSFGAFKFKYKSNTALNKIDLLILRDKSIFGIENLIASCGKTRLYTAKIVSPSASIFFVPVSRIQEVKKLLNENRYEFMFRCQTHYNWVKSILSMDITPQKLIERIKKDSPDIKRSSQTMRLKPAYLLNLNNSEKEEDIDVNFVGSRIKRCEQLKEDTKIRTSMTISKYSGVNIYKNTDRKAFDKGCRFFVNSNDRSRSRHFSTLRSNHFQRTEVFRFPKLETLFSQDLVVKG